MTKLLLVTGKVIAGFFGLIVLWLAGDWGWEKYKFYSWEPPTVIDGIYLGMTKSDVFFVKGKPKNCDQTNPSEETCDWQEEYSSSFQRVYFKSGTVEGITHAGTSYEIGTPFVTVEDMKAVLGDEDIMASEEGGLSRQYSYGDRQVRFGFSQNKLRYMGIGAVKWAQVLGKGEYFIRGKRVCPGENCPFDSETGEVKPEYQGKSYRDLLPRR